jgi:uncharacterized protein (DUF362 family)
MDRREFCGFMGICGLAACAGGLTGCARALEWSDAQHTAVVTRSFGGTPAPSVASDVPDLAIATGADAAANTRLAVETLGGMDRFVSHGAKVVIKPNIVIAREPVYGVTTNPDAVSAVVKMCLEAGAASVTVFDRPTAPTLQAYTVSGIKAAVQAAGGTMKVLSDHDFETIAIPKGKLLTSWSLLTDIFDADVMISMPCAKTHNLAGLTLSMKNLMGIMGGNRAFMHQDQPQKLVDLNTLIKPQLVILDAFRLLYRNGPTGGGLQDVKPGRTCVAGTSQVSVDAYGATLFGMQPTDLAYVKLAEQQGLGIADLTKLHIEKRSA